MARAIRIWNEGDGYIERLTSLAEELHREVSGGAPDPARVKELLAHIDDVNRRLTPLEDEFSFTLGEAARWIKGVILAVTVGATLLLLGVGVWVSRGILRDVLISEQRFRLLFERNLAGVFRATAEGRLLECNEALVRLLGYGSAEELIARSQSEPLLRREESGAIIERLRAEGSVVNLESRLSRKDGSEVWLLENLGLNRDRKGEEVLEGTVVDITARKRAEAAYEAALREKEVLLKEVHHRVKNNLQVISSLLNLEVEHVKDPDAIERFRESRNRVKAMALIHERLFRAPDLARLDAGEYVRSLAEGLFRSYAVPTSRVALTVSVEGVSVDPDRAITCGLLLNELISNSLKHAFPGSREGHLAVALSSRDGRVRLSVCDDGVGLPSGVDAGRAETLGLVLVHTLAHQLDGRIEWAGSPGTGVTVDFAADDSSERSGPEPG